MRFISINDLKLLIKRKIYHLETGSKEGDYLVYDRNSRTYVGHIEGAKFNNQSNTIISAKYFFQNEKYDPPRYIISEIEAFGKSENWDKGLDW